MTSCPSVNALCHSNTYLHDKADSPKPFFQTSIELLFLSNQVHLYLVAELVSDYFAYGKAKNLSTLYPSKGEPDLSKCYVANFTSERKTVNAPAFLKIRYEIFPATTKTTKATNLSSFQCFLVQTLTAECCIYNQITRL